MRFGDIVEAEWVDHTFVFNLYDGSGLTRVKTVGYFVSEDDEVLRIAFALEDGKPADVQVIDRRTLIKKQKVR